MVDRNDIGAVVFILTAIMMVIHLVGVVLGMWSMTSPTWWIALVGLLSQPLFHD